MAGARGRALGWRVWMVALAAVAAAVAAAVPGARGETVFPTTGGRRNKRGKKGKGSADAWKSNLEDVGGDFHVRLHPPTPPPQLPRRGKPGTGGEEEAD